MATFPFHGSELFLRQWRKNKKHCGERSREQFATVYYSAAPTALERRTEQLLLQEGTPPA